MYNEHEIRSSRFSITTVVIIAALALFCVVGNIYTFNQFSSIVRSLENKVATLETQISAFTDSLKNFSQVNLGNVTLSNLYENVRDSVVLIRATTASGSVSGSGFVYNHSGQMVINTNYHVIQDAQAGSIIVTFNNGHAYPAAILGSDAYVDFAVLSVDNAPSSEFKPLEIVSSSILKVGDYVIAVGNPYELVGSMTTGIVSQLGRAIPEEMAGGYSIANVIQISAPINPGNSGGPLLNSNGQVVGITFAIIENSTGVGFAIPSAAVLREISWLVRGDSYPHSWIGVMGRDMTYERAQQLSTSTTWGWEIVEVLPLSPASRDGLRVNDILLAINGSDMINGNDISNYLEAYTSPNDTILIELERSLSNMTLSLRLGTRPPP